MVYSVRQVVREMIRVDRYRYELVALPVDGNDYLGEWRCSICGRGGKSFVSHPHPSSALEWARNCVSVHHNSTHGD
jgi:hypothetical protein